MCLSVGTTVEILLSYFLVPEFPAIVSSTMRKCYLFLCQTVTDVHADTRKHTLIPTHTHVHTYTYTHTDTHEDPVVYIVKFGKCLG